MSAFDTLAPSAKSTFAERILTSDFDLRNGPQFDAARDLLYVAAYSKVAVFAKASELTGKILPTRTFTPKIFDTAYLSRMVLDSANDRLYVAYGEGPGHSTGFAIFDRASMLDGEVTPTRVITGPIDAYNFAIDFKHGVLYSKLSHIVNADIYVFTDIDKASGTIQPARRIHLNGNVTALGVDAERDLAYASVQNMGLAVLHNAATAASPSVTQTSLAIPLQSLPELLAADSRNDRLYIALENKAYFLDQASKLGQAGQQSAVPLGDGKDLAVGGFAFP